MKKLLAFMDMFRTIRYYDLTIDADNRVVADKNNVFDYKISYWALTYILRPLCVIVYVGMAFNS